MVNRRTLSALSLQIEEVAYDTFCNLTAEQRSNLLALFFFFNLNFCGRVDSASVSSVDLCVWY